MAKKKSAEGEDENDVAEATGKGFKDGQYLYVQADFTAQMNRYFRKFSKDDVIPGITGISFLSLERFTDAVNAAGRARMPRGQANVRPTITDSSRLRAMLEGEAVPNVEEAFAIVDVFAQHAGMVGDFATSFRSVTKQAILEQQAREEARKKVQEEERTRYNPEGKNEARSFDEMIKAAYKEGLDFQQFLFGMVLPEWGSETERMSSPAFCKHVAKLNEGKEGLEKDTVTNFAMHSWESKGIKPLRSSVDVLCHAFGLTPEEGQFISPAESMLWKMIQGRDFYFQPRQGDAEYGEAALTSWMNLAVRENNTAPLVRELVETSGIQFERLKQHPAFSQLDAWMRTQEGAQEAYFTRGAKISKIDNALEFIEAVHPEPTQNGKISKTNLRLLTLLSGREFDFDKIAKTAKEAGNPSGALMSALASREGIVDISSAEMIKAINEDEEVKKRPELMINEHTLHNMRSTTEPKRGSAIYEAQAQAYVRLVEQKAQKLIEAGVVKPFTDEVKSSWLDVMTGVEHPRLMLAKCVKGDMNIREMIRATYERKGLTLYKTNDDAPDGFCEEAKVHSLSKFLQFKRDDKGKPVEGQELVGVERETANKVADWYEANYQFTAAEKSQVVALMRGVDLKVTADTLLYEAMREPHLRQVKLKEIYDRAMRSQGINREQLAKAADVPVGMINYSCQKNNCGRLSGDSEAATRLGKALGISKEALRDFVEFYQGVTHAEAYRQVHTPQVDETGDGTPLWKERVTQEGAHDGEQRENVQEEQEQQEGEPRPDRGEDRLVDDKWQDLTADRASGDKPFRKGF